MTIQATYKNGVFTPRDPVDLPDGVEVNFEPRVVEAPKTPSKGMTKVYEILSRTYDGGVPTSPSVITSTNHEKGAARRFNSSPQLEFFMSTYTAVIRRDGEWWIGWIEEIAGVNSQGHTREELLENLESALKEAIEMNRSDAIAAANGEFEEASVRV